MISKRAHYKGMAGIGEPWHMKCRTQDEDGGVGATLAKGKGEVTETQKGRVA